MTPRSDSKSPVWIAGIASGLVGWSSLLTLSAARLLTGAPHDPTMLIAGLALGFALVTTGAALLILNALNAGFGALDAFFAAALARASQRQGEERPPPAFRPSQRGFIGDRPYIVNGDGTVTVETLLGPRLFPSLAEAQDFIGL